MAIKVTSDNHFYHANILTYESMMKFRGDLYQTVEEMNAAMIIQWNKDVSQNDTVIIVGDFCFGHGDTLRTRLREILPKLNGRFILVRGNHDPSKGDEVWQEFCHKVVDMYRHKDNKQLIVFCHYPLVSWEKSHYGSIMMHGHCHGKYQGPGRVIDVGWDVYGKVMDLQELIAIANKRAIVSVDGH